MVVVSLVLLQAPAVDAVDQRVRLDAVGLLLTLKHIARRLRWVTLADWAHLLFLIQVPIDLLV